MVDHVSSSSLMGWPQVEVLDVSAISLRRPWLGRQLDGSRNDLGRAQHSPEGANRTVAVVDDHVVGAEVTDGCVMGYGCPAFVVTGAHTYPPSRSWR